MKPLTTSLLIRCGGSTVSSAKYVAPLNAHLEQYGINTLLRLSHLLSQLLHESQGLTAVVENLNYSAVALMQTWPKRFPSVALANAYARQPERIANFVYANRMGNGPVESGDGWKYRGRSLVQLTGKGKYIDQTARTGIDYVTHPEWLERPDDGIRAALDFWKSEGLNALADTDSCEAVTLRVNGGRIGIENRKLLLARCKVVLGPLFANKHLLTH